jgi:hypothetical protein
MLRVTRPEAEEERKAFFDLLVFLPQSYLWMLRVARPEVEEERKAFFDFRVFLRVARISKVG